MPAKSRRRNQPNQVAKRTRVTIWTSIGLATTYAIVLVTSTVWESKAPPWVLEALDHRAGLLALVAATFGLLSIIVSAQTMPKTFLITVVAGGLTGYAAVINAFDPMSKEVAVAILIATLPVLALWTSTWRMPRKWEWAGWSAIGSIATLAIVVATVNTPLAVLIIALFGEDVAVGILGLATGIGVVVLAISGFAFVVKATGMALASRTRRGYR